MIAQGGKGGRDEADSRDESVLDIAIDDYARAVGSSDPSPGKCSDTVNRQDWANAGPCIPASRFGFTELIRAPPRCARVIVSLRFRAQTFEYSSESHGLQ